MEKQRLAYLLEQHLAGTATAQERQALSDILKADTQRELFNTVMAERMQAETPVLPADSEPWQSMVQRIVHLDEAAPAPTEKKKGRLFRLYPWAAAAAILLLVATGGYLFMNRAHMYETIDPNTTTHYSVISTARGGHYEVTLPDGSQVWLNSASSIRFPASFTGRERVVDLSGEAWFDVKHADKIPFRIHSGGITTTVLGTAFDIKAYPGQQATIVSVQRGRVRVQAGDMVLAVLEKGQQVRVGADTSVRQKNIDSSSVAAWKTGHLLYKDEVLADVVADLQRVFNDSIEIKRASLKKEITTVSFNKDIGIQKALDIISRLTDSRISNKNGIYTIE